MGVVVEDPEQEDFGWYLKLRYSVTCYLFILGYRPEDGGSNGVWIGSIEPAPGLLGTVLGHGRKEVDGTVLASLSEVIKAIPGISDVSWHHRGVFDSGDESRGTASPNEPGSSS